MTRKTQKGFEKRTLQHLVYRAFKGSKERTKVSIQSSFLNTCCRIDEIFECIFN